MAITTKQISLDFYNNNFVSVYAKQSDANSRYVNITCTDHGKKVVLDNNAVSAFVRMKKSDGNYIYNDAEILNDGTILVELTQQMLTATGKHVSDVMILSAPDVNVEELNSLDDIDNLNGVSVISVMPFYLIVNASSIDNSEIVSSSEFDTLVQATARLKLLEKTVRIAENSRIIAEDTRKDNENTRIANEKARQEAENKRQSDTANAVAAIADAKTATTNANNAADSATASATAANNAATAANDAVAEFESIKDQSGIVMNTEKGAANGIATLDSNGKVLSSQLKIANNLTTTTTGSLLDASQGNAIRIELEDLKEYIDTFISELPKIHFNNTIDNSIGRDGDILMVPIS